MGFIECTVEELQQMLRERKISTTQFASIMIDHMGKEAFMKAYNIALDEYFKDFRLIKDESNETTVQNKPAIQR